MIIASIFQCVADRSPITNLPDLLGLHHSNPLGLPVWLQLGIIAALAVAIAIVDYGIRYREKSSHYPALYALLGVETLLVYYYCFMRQDRGMGWFCNPDRIGWGWGLLGLVAVTFVISTLINAWMQVAAQLSVEAGLKEGKPWKEWKVAVHILLDGVLATTILWFFAPVASSWLLIATVILLVAFALYKVVADSLRSHHWGWGLLIGLSYLAGALACMMLTLECLRGGIFFAVVIAALLIGAKARQKKVKTKRK